MGTIKNWLKNKKLESLREQAMRIEDEANSRYNIIQRINHDGKRETYLTFDGFRISMDYSDNYGEAVKLLFALRLSYMAEVNNLTE